jgi:exopolyphosphatase/guanosine-5'-triphosphate,3'-diphosphate pyrophosphatase
LDKSRFASHFAAIDIGSHTTRLIVVRLDGSELLPLCNERRVTRLARDFQRSGTITDEARQRNIAALKEYADILRTLGVGPSACGATGVVRRARNSDAVLAGIAAETGISARILSEQEEAFLSAKAMLSVLPRQGDDFLLFDVGGGSTELLLAASGRSEPAWCTSLPFGAATLTDSYLRLDPPGIGSTEKACTFVAKEINAAKEQMCATLAKIGIIPVSSRVQLSGTAGTVTTLAAMHVGMLSYNPFFVNGLVLSEEWLSKIILKLAAMPLSDRRRIPGLEQGREDIILGGAVIVAAILACFERKGLTVTDAGLLEGLLIELIEQETGLRGGLRTSLTWRMQKG